MKLSPLGKEDGQFRIEKQVDLEAPMPQKTWRIEVLILVRIVADSADIVSDKSRSGLCDGVVGDDGIAGLSKAFSVDKSKMAYI
jgi:hypothetical protein